MCCALTIVVFFGPRIALFILWLTGFVQAAYGNIIVPCLGFIFLPWTTLGYAMAVNWVGGLDNGGFILVAIGILLDILSYGGGAWGNRGRVPGYSS